MNEAKRDAKGSVARAIDRWLGAAAGRFALAAAACWDNKLTTLIEMTERLRSELRTELRKRFEAEERARVAEAKLKLVEIYFSDIPKASAEDVTWTPDDQRQLADFLEVKPAGKKLAQHLANRLSDYERQAFLFARMADVPLAVQRTRGFRDCRGEISRLSVAGPSPAKSEGEGFALPPDLESFRA